MPAGNTYEAIATQTLGSAAASVTFSSIPSTYTDLVLVVTGTVSTGDNLALQFNGDTGNNYSWTYLIGSGSSAVSARTSNTNQVLSIGFGTSTIANAIWQINNYSNTTTNKTVINRGNRSDDGVSAWVGLWRNTAAINSIVVKTGGGYNLNTGTVVSLYGIAAA